LNIIERALLSATAADYGRNALVEDTSNSALPGLDGDNSPFLHPYSEDEMHIPNRTLIITQCRVLDQIDSDCQDTSDTIWSTFAKQCLLDARILDQELHNNGTEGTYVDEDIRLVKKAVHLIQHPLDNVVAHFNAITETAKNVETFQRWCANMDESFTVPVGMSFQIKEKLEKNSLQA
jgi:hypothetical protein